MSKKYISDSFVKTGGSTFQYLMADGSTSTVVSDGIPTVPLEITSSGYVGSVIGNATTFISLSDWFKSIFIYPLINKQYPEYTDLVNVYTSIPSVQGTISGVIVETITFNNLDAVANSFSVFEYNVRKVIYPTLKYIAGTISFTITNGVFDEISMPVLKGVFATFTIPLSTTLTTINFPLLEVGSFSNINTSLISIVLPEALQLAISDLVASPIVQYSFPKVKVLSLNLNGSTKSSLTTIDLPVVEIITNLVFPSSSTSLTTINLGTSLKACNINFVTTSNSLTQASVDNILVSLSLLDGTGGTVAYSTKTITITGSASTPSATGLAAKAILVSRGCTVTNN